jgi:glucosamine--fructose-6-phosphate aminotransferase (isomerizing)
MTPDMLAEIDAQARLAESLPRVESAVDDVVQNLEAGASVHLLGSGDSYFAAEAVVPFFQTTEQSRCHAYTAAQFSQYVAPHIGSADLVIPISVSGNSTRTVEAAERAAETAASVVCVTNSESGLLYREFPDSILMGLETEPGWVPGTLTYLGLVTTLYYLGIQLGTPPATRDEHVRSLHRTVESVHDVIEAAKPTATDVAANLSYTDPPQPFYVLGGGPSRATAQYGAAKFLEIGDTLAIGQESEEFAHQEFWVLEKSNPVFVVAPTGPSFSRTEEVAECIREFGNDLVVVTDSDDLADLGKYAFELPSVEESFSPLLSAIPLQLIAYYYALERGFDMSDGSHIDPHRVAIADKIHSGKRY